jgi:ABC-type Fe3+-hydroxamate transport system substrate-binding protein
LIDKEYIKSIIRGLEQLKYLPFEVKAEKFREVWKLLIEQVGAENLINFMVELFTQNEEQMDALIEAVKTFYEKLLVKMEIGD